MKKYNLGIFVFTRDLRLSDNNSLTVELLKLTLVLFYLYLFLQINK